MRTNTIPTPEQPSAPERGGIPRMLPYRLVRARRLLALCILLPTAAAWAGAAAPSAAVPFGAPDWPLMVAGAAALLFALMIQAYPQGTTDNLALAVAAAAAVAALPGVLALVPLVPRNQAAAGVLFPVLLACAAFALWLGLVWLSGRLSLPKRDGWTTAMRARTALPPDAALDALVPRPGQAFGRVRCGPAGPDGWYEVFTTHHGVDLATFAPTTAEHRYRTKILEDGPGRRVCLSAVAIGGVWRTSTSEITSRAAPGGAICEIRECTDCLGPLEIAAWWLNDIGTDYLVSRFCAASGQASPALLDQPLDSPLIALARVLRGMDLHEPG